MTPYMVTPRRHPDAITERIADKRRFKIIRLLVVTERTLMLSQHGWAERGRFALEGVAALL